MLCVGLVAGLVWCVAGDDERCLTGDVWGVDSVAVDCGRIR